MVHTIVVHMPDEPKAGRRDKTPDEIEVHLTEHIERWAGWSVEVIEYHHEKITQDPPDPDYGP